jgi:Protein of unknown function (DUF1549)/Planctomycete cytochrome C
MKQYSKLSALAALLFIVPSLACAQEKKPSAAAVQFFEMKVRPILVANCFECHAEKKQRGDLRLDSLAAMLEGGEQGPAIVPGHPEKSLLVKAINQDGKLKMPKNKKLSRDEIDALTQWIKMGAPWPGSDKATPTRKGEFQISDKDRAHWAYQPVKRPTPPNVKHQAWVRNPIDAFILAKLEAKGLAPAPPASKQEIARRLYYDITGLPPTPRDIEVFVNDPAGDAYEKLVDKLLATPQYGEKWARHWLDLVRYAETNSYERDNPKRTATNSTTTRSTPGAIAIMSSAPSMRTSHSTVSCASNWPAMKSIPAMPTPSSPPAFIAWASGTMSRSIRSKPAMTAWTTSSPPSANRCLA